MLNGRAGTAGVTKGRTRFLVDEERSAVGGLIAGREQGLTGDARQRREAAEKRRMCEGRTGSGRTEGQTQSSGWLRAKSRSAHACERGDD